MAAASVVVIAIRFAGEQPQVATELLEDVGGGLGPPSQRQPPAQTQPQPRRLSKCLPHDDGEGAPPDGDEGRGQDGEGQGAFHRVERHRRQDRSPRGRNASFSKARSWIECMETSKYSDRRRRGQRPTECATH